MKGKKQMKKTNEKKIICHNGFGKWEIQLPLYLDLYSKLNDQGKKEMKYQLKHLGKLVDIVQKAKNKGGE
tara:strand:- start:386 stop:595 length:210 start_codon:yes stop_codon:yes gene_type:complete